jgi:hypothetical protein
MVEVTISSLTPSTVPTDGWLVRYRIKGTTGGYTTPVGSPYTSLPIVFSTTDAAGTLYEIQVAKDCGTIDSDWFDVSTPCDCTTAGYTPTIDDDCRKTTTIDATVSNSGFCLVASTNAVYSSYSSRIYNPTFTNSTLFLPPSTSSADIYGEMTLDPQWANLASSVIAGPLNRNGVWVDSDCDGNKDALGSGIDVITILTGGSGYANGSYSNVPILGGSGSGATANFIVSGGIVTIVNEASAGSGYVAGESISVDDSLIGGGTGFTMEVGSVGPTSLTVSFMYNNVGVARRIFIGVGADNQFKVIVNGVVKADTGTTGSLMQFRMWHIIPVDIVTGINLFNVVAIGDGTFNDAVGMVGYDNTAAEIYAATSDSGLNILFQTSTLRGTTFDVATCPDDYSLDSSGGSGSYTCVKIEIKPCNTAT